MENQDGLSDFMRFAYKCNKVRDIKEAFKEYPVEEEWHQGKEEEWHQGKIEKVVSE